jgi:phospholipid/cholesterol/gamma-HCH transport system substrate-binding protein
MKITREVKIGIFVVSVILVFVLGISFLKGKNVFRKHRTLYVVYDQVSGLEKAAPVTINGLKIGMVSEVGFLSSTSTKILVELTLYNNVNIPSNSIARIYSPDLLGSKNIQIIIGNSVIYASNKDTLQSDIQATLSEEVSQQVAPLKAKAESLMLSLDTILTAFHSVFNTSSRENFTSSLEHIKQTILNLESATYKIDTLLYRQRGGLERIMFNIESITQNIRQNNDNLNRIITNFSNISDTLAKAKFSHTINDLHNTISNLSEITDKINKGQGSLGMLINNQKIYNDLEATTKELNLLMQDIKLNPYRYINFSVFPPGGKKMKYKEPNHVSPVEVTK